MVDASWYRILQAACRLCQDGKTEFTSHMLAREAGLHGPRAGQVASAWLAKFVRWGYVSKRRKAIPLPHGGRPSNAYLVTEKGRDCAPREGRVSQLHRLVGAVREFEGAKTAGRRANAWAALLSVTSEVEASLQSDRSIREVRG